MANRSGNHSIESRGRLEIVLRWNWRGVGADVWWRWVGVVPLATVRDAREECCGDPSQAGPFADVLIIDSATFSV